MKAFQQFGIYLFPCNKCDDGLHALHLQVCLKPGCASKNYFFKQNHIYDKLKWKECFKEIVQ